MYYNLEIKVIVIGCHYVLQPIAFASFYMLV